MSLQKNEQMFKLTSYREYAAKLKAARLGANMSATEIAELCGLAQPQLSRIENGQQQFFTGRTKERVEKLASALNVTGLRFTEVSYAEVRGQKASPKFSAETAQTVVVSGSTLQRVGKLLELHREGLIPEQAAIISIKALVA